MAVSKPLPAKIQKLVRSIYRAGQANEILGWLWIVNALFIASEFFVFSNPNSGNPFLSIGSIIASFAPTTVLLLVVLSVGMALLHLSIGLYVKHVGGTLTKRLLLIGAIASGLSVLNVLPVITSVLSFIGYFGARSLNQTSKAKSKPLFFNEAAKRKLAFLAIGITAPLVLAAISFARLHANAPAKPVIDKSQGHQQSTVIDFTDYPQIKIAGYCMANPKPNHGCRFASKAYGFTATFPASDQHRGTPSVELGYLRLSGGQTQPLIKVSALTGYYVHKTDYKTQVTGPTAINWRLQDTALFNGIDLVCPYSPSSEATTATFTPAAYGNLPILSIAITGNSIYDKKPCTFYALAIMKGLSVYVVSVINSGYKSPVIKKIDFDTYVTSIELN